MVSSCNLIGWTTNNARNTSAAKRRIKTGCESVVTNDVTRYDDVEPGQYTEMGVSP